MKQIQIKSFYSGIIIISIFEILNVYFIMPMPGSQEIDSIDTAYFLYTNRWYFRIFAGLLVVPGIITVFKNKPNLVPAIVMIAAIAIIYIFNFHMNAESMFKQPEKLVLNSREDNIISDSSIVICVENNGYVKAYPVSYLSYHHQVQDSVGNLSLIITYCNVCRTGRVFIPKVKGHPEKFRLVGMDHYNAMFEDSGTKSWWRQATGEAIAGPLKGEFLPEMNYMQITARKLFELYPHALVMQPDKKSIRKYDTSGKFEQGKSTGRLTRTDTLSWKDKSWIIGIQTGDESKAYDWNYLKNQRIINDKIGTEPVIIVLSTDGQSFAAFKRPEETKYFSLQNDTLFADGEIYDLSGMGLGTTTKALTKVNAYQEFWHSWQTFNPGSQKYNITDN
jgi:hypothetical protein